MSLDLDRIPRRAPGPQARVNWLHPLAQGLVAVGCGRRQWSDRATRTTTAVPSVLRTPIETPFGPGLGDRTADNDGGYDFTTKLPIPGRLTLAVVVRCTAASPDGSGAILWTNSDSQGVLLGVGAANAAGPNLYALDQFVAHHTTSAAIAQTGWRHIAVTTVNGSGTMLLYRDALQVSSQTGGHTTNAGLPSVIRIGSGAPGAIRAFDGQISAWAAWNRILSAGELAAHYQDPFCMLTEE